MRKTVSTAALAIAAFTTAPALADPAAPAAAATPATEAAAPAETAAPAAPAAAEAAPQYSQEQLRQYLKAAIKVNEINADTAVAANDKPMKMMEAVKAEGLEPTTFNAIAQASQTDAELQQKLQVEMAALQQQNEQQP